MICDAIIVGYAVNSTSGGFTNGNVKYLDTVGIKYLYSHFYGTYCAEPVAFLQLAAEIRSKGLNVEILDGLLMGYSLDEMKENLLKYDAKVYCFSLYESSRTDVVGLMKYVKSIKPDAIVVTGGPYVTLCYKELLESETVIDYIVIGDGDNAMPMLIDAVCNKKTLRGIPNVVYRDNYGKSVLDVEPEAVDMNKLQPISRDFVPIIKEKGFSLSIASSRGCGHGVCSFCYLKQYQKNSNQPKFRFRSPELVVSEIKELVNEYGIDKLTFVDDDFFGPDSCGVERAVEFFQRIIDADIHLKLYMNVRVASIKYLISSNLLELASKAGVKYFFVGFESYNDEVLKRYHKGITTDDIDYIVQELDKYGIEVNPGMITFEHASSPIQVYRNVSLLKRLKYYDLFMFTRTLMKLPNDNSGTRDNRVKKGDFLDERTEKLYNSLVCLRDQLYPLYGLVDRRKITDEIRNSIIAEHYKGFESIYDAIMNSNDEHIQEVIDKCVCQVHRFVELVS